MARDVVIDAALAAGLTVPLWRHRDSVSATAPSGDTFAGHRRLARNRRAMILYVLVLVEGAAFFGEPDTSVHCSTASTASALRGSGSS